MLLQNTTTGELDTKLATRGFTKDVNCTDKLKHEVIKEMVLHKSPSEIPITRPELKRKMGLIRTVEQTKKYKTVSIKRVTVGEAEDEIKVPYGYIG